jgi:GTP-binding protein
VGLGLDFLRHVERTRLLLHVVDISGSEGRDPIADYEQINKELAQYGDLSSRPQIVVCNKCDLNEAEENVKRMREHLKGKDIPVFSVSAATRKGFDELMDATSRLLNTLPPPAPFEVEEAPFELEEKEGFTVSKTGGVYDVTGPAMVRLLDSVNFSEEESMNWFHRTLRRMGVIDALREAGAREGDTVRIEDMEFDFVE